MVNFFRYAIREDITAFVPQILRIILPSKEIQNSIGNKTKEAVYMSSSVIKDVDRIISELY